MNNASTHAPVFVLAALVEQTEEGLAYLDPAEFRIVHVNGAYAAAIGHERSELSGKRLFDLLPDPDGQRILERVRDTGEPASWRERPWVFTDQPERGTTYWTWTAMPDHASDGTLRGIVVSLRDVTEDVERRARDRARAERLELALDAGRMGTWDWHISSDIATDRVEWNDVLFRMLGYEPGSVVPTYLRWMERVHPDDRAATRARMDASLERGGDYLDEFRVLWPDGTIRWIEARGRLVRDPEGKPVRQYGVNLDITERKETEQALRDADRRKSEFLAALSHELRNPLAPITSSLYVLEHVPPDSPDAHRVRAVITRQVAQLTRLVDDLLDLTRIARNKVRIEPAPLELATLLRQVVEDHRALFARAGVELAFDAPSSPLPVRGDAQRLAQVVGNLLSNAAKFTPRGGHARVEARSEAGSAVIAVVDDGVGISPATLARLFEPFAQGEVTFDRSRGGLGLGLALAKGLVELHGGTIAAYSEGAGLGSRFELRLPLIAPESVARAATQREAAASRSVLVIEDNVDAAEMLRAALMLGGHRVELAFDGVTGVERARALRPEVVLCDLGLPGMNGFEVARALRGEPSLSETSLVALSGYAMPEDRRQAREAGFDEHLAKPPDLAKLAAILRDPPRAGAAPRA